MTVESSLFTESDAAVRTLQPGAFSSLERAAMKACANDIADGNRRRGSFAIAIASTSSTALDTQRLRGSDLGAHFGRVDLRVRIRVAREQLRVLAIIHVALRITGIAALRTAWRLRT